MKHSYMAHNMQCVGCSFFQVIVVDDACLLLLRTALMIVHQGWHTSGVFRAILIIFRGIISTDISRFYFLSLTWNKGSN